MKLLDDYLKLQKQIYDHFGYKEGWTVIPLDDATEYYWVLEEEHNRVTYSKKKENLVQDEDEDFPEHGDYYQDEVKGVYEAPDYTMIVLDTNTDFNKFLQVFDNAKRIV